VDGDRTAARPVDARQVGVVGAGGGRRGPAPGARGAGGWGGGGAAGPRPPPPRPRAPPAPGGRPPPPGAGAGGGGCGRHDLREGLARDVLAPAATGLTGSGVRLIHLEEPWIPYAGIDDASWQPFQRAVGAIREAAGDAVLVLHAYYGDAAPHADGLRRLPVDAIGVDFVETPLDALPAPWETGLAAGVLDGRRSVIEDPADVAAFVRRAADRLEPTAVFVTSGSDLELAGPEVAGRKVGVLGDVARRLRQGTA
jgi:hypothetical protein